MNDSELKAMYEQINKYTGTSRLNPFYNNGFKAGFKAACEWMRSQGEPYLWMTEWWVEGGPDNGEYEYETNHSNEFSCGRKNGFPLYRHPPTAQINEQMREALQCLLAAVQNCHCENSGAAQELAHAALEATPK